MLYFVTTDHFGGPPPPPDQFGPLLEAVSASVEKLNQLLEDGKIIAGGVPAGQKRHVFIVEADSNDEVTELVQSLPFFMAHRWEITPLESWSHHLDFVQSMKP
jgi:muconolactone delta-isomerase